MSHITEQPVSNVSNVAFSANKTFQVTYPVPIGNASTNRGVAKGDKLAGDVDPRNNNQYGALSSKNLDETQSEVQKDLNLISRSVASSQVSAALGLSSVVPEAYAKTSQGDNLGVSALASGEQVQTSIVDAAGMPLNTITRQFDFSDPRIQKGLYDLEAVDYLTGQIDRHGGNIFINSETGQVEGIDNDLCLGEKPLSVALTDGEIGAKAVGKPPLIYHKDTAAAIEQMTPAKLAGLLRGVHDADGKHGLDQPEMSQALLRLETMKRDIQLARADGRVVEEFNKLTFAASLEHHEAMGGEARIRGKVSSAGNYLGRCHADLHYAMGESLKAGTADIIQQPSGGRQLDGYETGLQERKEGVKQARDQAVQQPTAELAQALQEKAAAQSMVQALRDDITRTLERSQPALDKQLAIQEKQIAVKAERLAKLEGATACVASRDGADKLSAEQKKLIHTMVSPDIGHGEKLEVHEVRAINNKLSELRRKDLLAMREAKLEIEQNHVSARAGLQDKALQGAVARLEKANEMVDRCLKEHPIVQHAMAQEAAYIEEHKEGLKLSVHEQVPHVNQHGPGNNGPGGAGGLGGNGSPAHGQSPPSGGHAHNQGSSSSSSGWQVTKPSGDGNKRQASVGEILHRAPQSAPTSWQRAGHSDQQGQGSKVGAMAGINRPGTADGASGVAKLPLPEQLETPEADKSLEADAAKLPGTAVDAPKGANVAKLKEHFQRLGNANGPAKQGGIGVGS